MTPTSRPVAKAREIAALVLGIIGALIGTAHGVYETQQGTAVPSSIFINAIGGTQCQPNCLPALTVLPNFLVAGIVTTVVGIILLIWSLAMRRNPRGAAGQILFGVIFFLGGGGYLAPPLVLIGAILQPRVKRAPAS